MTEPVKKEKPRPLYDSGQRLSLWDGTVVEVVRCTHNAMTVKFVGALGKEKKSS